MEAQDLVVLDTPIRDHALEPTREALVEGRSFDLRDPFVRGVADHQVAEREGVGAG